MTKAKRPILHIMEDKMPKFFFTCFFRGEVKEVVSLQPQTSLGTTFKICSSL